MASFDRRAVARLEKVYASAAVAEQRRRTRAALAARPGERGLDVGCGPAFLACELARDVGPDGRIVGIDASPDVRAAAAARIAREGVADRVEVRAGDAAHLDFAPASFDFVVAVQVYLYVHEVPRALGEAARVLRPGGRLAVVDTDWDSCVWLGDDRDRTRRVLEGRVAQFANPHLPPRLPGLLREAGLRLRHAEVVPLLELSGEGVTFSGDLIEVTAEAAVRHGLGRDEAEAWKADLLRRAGGGDYFFSVNRFLFVADKPAPSDAPALRPAPAPAGTTRP